MPHHFVRRINSMEEKPKQLIYLAAMILFIGAALLGFKYIGNQRAEAARIEKEKVKQVSVIPPGTEVAWQAFIDRRVAAVLRREGRLVRLDDDSHRNLIKTASYISINAPYQITCALDTASVQFGTDGEGDNNQGVNDSAELFNAYLKGTTADKVPTIDVPQESIAAATLRDHVCQYLASKVQTVLSADAPHGDTTAPTASKEPVDLFEQEGIELPPASSFIRP